MEQDCSSNKVPRCAATVGPWEVKMYYSGIQRFWVEEHFLFIKSDKATKSTPANWNNGGGRGRDLPIISQSLDIFVSFSKYFYIKFWNLWNILWNVQATVNTYFDHKKKSSQESLNISKWIHSVLYPYTYIPNIYKFKTFT